jgi:hypothetical protein
MLGTALRLLAAGEAGRHLGAYVKNLTTRYLMLAVAGMIFSTATVFGMLAAFWAINTKVQNPIWSALIMLGSLVLAGFLIVLIAYGSTRARPKSANTALRNTLQDPVQALQAQLPSVDEVGHQIEEAVRRYGPFQVAAAAAAGGVVAGLLAKRFGQVTPFEPRRRRPYDSRRDRRYRDDRFPDHYA